MVSGHTFKVCFTAITNDPRYAGDMWIATQGVMTWSMLATYGCDVDYIATAHKAL